MHPGVRSFFIVMVLMIPFRSLAAQATSHPETQPSAEMEPQSPNKPVDPVADFIQKSKTPFDWWTWGADLRLREVYIGNAITLDKHDPNHEIHWQRQRTRWWSTFTPTEDLEFNLRIAWEGKHFDKPDSRENWQPTSASFDRLNFKLKNIGDSPFTIQAGRQEFMFVDRWLVMDGTPLDGSTTTYFDGIRLTGDFPDIASTLDLIYLETDVEGDNWINPLYDHDVALVEQDETGVIAWLTNRSLPGTQLHGYFIYKQARPGLTTGYEGEIYTFGGRVERAFTPQISWSTNIASQFGHKNDRNLSALGSLNRLQYSLKDKWKSALGLEYEYLSGDDPDTETDESFDLLWGRWPRFSEMYIYTNIAEGGRIGDASNLHRLAFGYTGHPSHKMEVHTQYQLLFAGQNTYAGEPGFSQSGCFRGQLVTARLKYQWNSFLASHLLGEFFFPGEYYTDERNDVASFLRAELVFSW